MQKIKWLGKEKTLIRKTIGGLKIEIKPNEVVEVSDEIASYYAENAYRKSFDFLAKVATGNVKEKKISKAKKDSKK